MTSPQAHLSALGLTRNPFPPTPDARCYFYTDQLDRDCAEVLHCVLARKGFLLVTGEVGLGKTTFVRRLLDTVADHDIAIALVFNTFLQGRELLATINRDFGLPAREDMAANMAVLNDFLLEQAKRGKTTVMVVDDAQNLTDESLEMVRLLSNLESGQEKLLQIVLAGQPELIDKLEQENLRQLKSRIVKHVHLEGLSLRDTGRYFEFRINDAGGAGRLTLDGGALKLLHQTTGGNLRRIHLILDRCLYGLVSRRSSVINRALIQQAITETEIGRKTATPKSIYHIGWLATMAAIPVVAYAAWQGGYLAAAHKPVLTVAPSLATPMSTVPVPQAKIHPAAATISPPSSAKAPESAKPPTSPDLGHCLQRPEFAQVGRTSAASNLHMASIPAAADKYLTDGPGLCRYEVNGTPWVVWQTGGQNRDLQAPAPNAALQHLQTRLAALGFYHPQAIDGYFGPLTRAALARFQASLGLTAQGEPDDLTLLLLDKTS